MAKGNAMFNMALMLTKAKREAKHLIVAFAKVEIGTVNGKEGVGGLPIDHKYILNSINTLRDHIADAIVIGKG